MYIGGGEMDLMLRLRILREAGQLKEKNYEAILKVIELLNTRWGVVLTEDNGAAFTTHLAIAFERMDKSEPVAGIGDYIMQELTSQPCFSQSGEALKAIAVIYGREIPEYEEGYILIHLCTLFSKEEIK
jgi:transcriptional regulatory protein LevR